MILAACLLAGGCGPPAVPPPPGKPASDEASRCERTPPQPESLPGARSFTYREASGRALRLHVFGPDKAEAGRAAPGIIFFFGGGWKDGMVTSFLAQAGAFARHGYVAILADYRVKCRDGTTPLASTKDARAAYAWVRQHAADLGIDPRRVVLAGGSAGGQLAAATAMLAPKGEKPVALVLFNPAVDLVTPAPWYLKPMARWVSPNALSFADLPPTIIFHGQSDRTVPIDSVRTFCRKALAALDVCEINEYRGRDHGFYHDRAVDPVIGRSPYEDTLLRALAFVDRRARR